MSIARCRMLVLISLVLESLTAAQRYDGVFYGKRFVGKNVSGDSKIFELFTEHLKFLVTHTENC
jgi:hypothetical protein